MLRPFALTMALLKPNWDGVPPALILIVVLLAVIANLIQLLAWWKYRLARIIADGSVTIAPALFCGRRFILGRVYGGFPYSVSVLVTQIGMTISSMGIPVARFRFADLQDARLLPRRGLHKWMELRLSNGAVVRIGHESTSCMNNILSVIQSVTSVRIEDL